MADAVEPQVTQQLDEMEAKQDTAPEVPTVGRRLFRSTTRGIDMLRRMTLRSPPSPSEAEASASEHAQAAAAKNTAAAEKTEESEDNEDDSQFWSGRSGGGFL
ncbi:hypothetical protein PINS_up010247 [Pythium insidiosum]|nr:hypothetical protein PINS_up010247 [Pythium insidiosum]